MALGSVHTELLAMAKKWKLNIINGTIHTGLSEILSYACGKRQIFAMISLRNGEGMPFT